MRPIKLVIVLLFVLSPFFLRSQIQKVLVLHSYHQGLRWTDDISQGILSVLNEKPGIEIQFEYLDTKRNSSAEYIKALTKLFSEKYRSKNCSVIIAVDNNALNFAMTNRKSFFANLPIVFCGINNFNRDMLMGDKLITGVTEIPDFIENIELMRSLNPDIEKVKVVNDNKTTTSLLNKKEMLEIVNIYKSIEFEFVEDVELEDLPKVGETDNTNEAIFLLTYNKDKNNEFVSSRECAELVAMNSRIPVYSPWDFSLNTGVLGGKMVSGFQQGKSAAQICEKILNGKSPETIPILYGTPNHHKFDYYALSRHHVDTDLLPNDSIIINSPTSFWARHKAWLAVVFVLLLIFSFIVSIFVRANARSKAFQAQLFEEKSKLKENLNNTQILANIAKLLNQADDFTKVVDDMLEVISTGLGIYGISVYSFIENKNGVSHIKSRYLKANNPVQNISKLEHTPVEHLISLVKQGAIVERSDLDDFEIYERRYFEKRNIKSLLLYPITVDEKVEGVLGFIQNKEYQWPEDMKNLLNTINHILTGAWKRKKHVEQRLRAEILQTEAMQMAEESSRLEAMGTIVSEINQELNKPLENIDNSLSKLEAWANLQNNISADIQQNIRFISDSIKSVRTASERILKFWIDKQRNLFD